MTQATPERASWTTWLLRRWPTALALGASALTFGGSASDAGMTGMGQVLPLLPLLYLVMAKLRRPSWTWPGLAIGFAAVFSLRALDIAPPATVFTAIALAVLVWAGVDGQLGKDGTFQIQAIGMLVFGGLAIAGIIVDPDLGRYLVAAGWFFHGVWDFVHLKLNKVVARSFAEWCGVVDVLVAAELVFMF
ncbi:hypothetical protein HII36_51165 [Nonomuraea sp. NN258]|uniref:hypothetical protein n=1 Tax=Nonomuraea antri TaxID=2730852 RepID=UPI001569A684|nr:hypothetical protein [Nonomuraea antri]NRQ40132.1 hypothetical protein [Nonomuraea antri]